MVSEIRSQYLRFAEFECKGNSPWYAELASVAASSHEICEFIGRMPVTQPNLFFASVQYLAGIERMPRNGEELKDFVSNHHGELADIMQTRRTQTNEVGRCATILPALPNESIALIEVGASAGLCLLPEFYYYDYATTTLGSASAAVKLECKIETGNPPLPLCLPNVLWRGGLDINPLSMQREDDRKWLLSCVWPDQLKRRQRLEAAIKTARKIPVDVRRGDLVEDLPRLIAEVPEDVPLVIFHSAVLAYVSVEKTERFCELLSRQSVDREIIWIVNESPLIVKNLVSTRFDAKPGNFLLARFHYKNGGRSDEVLAETHPHGASMEWFSP